MTCIAIGEIGLTTERQKAANRSNARKSTGPKSLKGKDKSKRNALKHGLTADIVLLAGEDPSDYERLKRSVARTYRPTNDLQRILVNSIAANMWRLMRVPGFETALFETLRPAGDTDGEDVLWDMAVSAEAQEGLRASLAQPELGTMILMAISKENVLNRLGRYETHLCKRVEAAVQSLMNAQRKRADEKPKKKPTATTTNKSGNGSALHEWLSTENGV